MKTLKTLFLAFAMLVSYTINAQVAVTTDGSSADGSAMLEVKSTTKGFLPPRMTKAELDAISSPATGLIVFCTNCGDNGQAQIYNGTEWTNMIGGAVLLPPPDVISPTTGKIWMRSNLGASQVATSSTDEDSYGDLYQWGRGTDGHQVRTSGTTATYATTAVPNGGNIWDGLFITAGEGGYWDWLTPQDDDLWQGVSGTNNPCPSGYRLPTEAEWEAERASWSSQDDGGAFASPLKLPFAGRRHHDSGTVYQVGSYGGYWSANVDGIGTRMLFLNQISAYIGGNVRAEGVSVRCIKD